MMPDTSQIARAAATASSPAVEDEKTRFTVRGLVLENGAAPSG
jgi:hypothetical protein